MSGKRKAPARPARKPKPSAAEETVLVLRTCNADGTAHGGFRWPESGKVSAPDWNPAPVCGQGLHGFLWGEGDGTLASWEPDARWLVVEVRKSDVVDLGGDKVKFPRGVVMFCGPRLGATQYLAAHDPLSATRKVIGGTAMAGVGGTATAGYRGIATAGNAGTATAGDHGTAMAGDSGTAMAGYGGTATAGNAGTATAGVGGIIHVRWWDEVAIRYRVATGYVGEGGIKPGVRYRVEGRGVLTEVLP